jgi:hypothetical protein
VIDEPVVPAEDLDRSGELALWRTLDLLVDFYQAFDTTPRAKLKPRLKELYEALAELAPYVGVSRLSMGALWNG